MPKIIATEREAGIRLDQMLAEHLNISRSKIQKLIKLGSITVNNKICKPNHTVETKDKIDFPKTETALFKKNLKDAPALEVLYEDDNLIVINKPAGLIVHPAMEEDPQPTIVDAVLKIHPEIQTIGDDPSRPGIVQRLDKDVSGVMVIAKTQEMFDNLKQQFKNRSVKKEYLALVYGKLPKDHDTIKLLIARSKTKGRMVARPADQKGKEALTEWDVIKEFKNTTYTKIKIQTGRTHQIRVHFSAIDHPLVGDKLYKKRKMRHVKPIEINRIFLHAHKLSIKLKDGSQKTFTSPLPAELETILQNQPTK